MSHCSTKQILHIIIAHCPGHNNVNTCNWNRAGDVSFCFMKLMDHAYILGRLMQNIILDLSSNRLKTVSI